MSLKLLGCEIFEVMWMSPCDRQLWLHVSVRTNKDVPLQTYKKTHCNMAVAVSVICCYHMN